MRPFWRRILIAGAFAVGVAIVGLLALNAYALLSDDDGGAAPHVAQPTEIATPSPAAAVSPAIDVALSRQCYKKFLDLRSTHRLMSQEIPPGYTATEWWDKALGSGYAQDMLEASRFIEERCLSPAVVPVRIPTSDIASLCIAARAEASWLAKIPAEDTAKSDVDWLTLLEQFARSRCP